jgi:DNA adenine methylase
MPALLSANIAAQSSTQSAIQSSARDARPFARPFLKWAGGKGQLIEQYLDYLPHPTTFTTYHEPFLGGGAIFFHLAPQRAILADVNPELVNVYQCVKTNAAGLIRKLERHQSQHSPDYYYEVRSQPVKTNLDRAARLIYLNKTCFNGLYRENSKGQFNVPIGRYKNPRICDPENLNAVAIALKSVAIASASFEAVLEQATGAADFVYFDPPYYPISNTSKFTAYNRCSFTEADQVRLRDVALELANRGVKVMLSNSDCPFIRDLYSDFNVYTIYASRSINANAQKRSKITEVLATSY